MEIKNTNNLVDEIICGFKVTKKRKMIWYKELEMVKLCLDVCKKYDLKIMASGGTLIGAIRHNGFIPWDDDIDLMMPREDYEKFLDVIEKEIPEGYFAQSLRTEKNYSNGHFQLRNSNTTCLISADYSNLKSKKNCGLWVDIFPYDAVSEDEAAYEKESKEIDKLKKICWRKGLKEVNFKNIVKKCLTACYTKPVEFYIKKIDELAKNHKESTLVGLQSFMPGYRKNVWKKDLFDEVIYHKFEDIELPIPAHYDEVLRVEFGDYMKIPENKNGSIHGECYVDFDNSYTKYQGLTQKEFKKLFEQIDY